MDDIKSIIFDISWSIEHMAAIQNASELAINTRRYVHLRDRLRDEYPDIDDDTLSDTLEGITDFRETLAEIIRSALVDELFASCLSTRISDMKARLDRFQRRAERKRELALKAMAEAELSKLVQADFTASIWTCPGFVEG
jgi:hypothetical protein